MKLTGTVSKIESGAIFTDGVQRAIIKVNEAESPMYAEIRVRNTERWEIDKILVIEVYHPTMREAADAGLVARGA